EAKSEDMRAFVEEAGGVSRYKERRKETEARIAETRDNLERLQDVRDEVEKQIRHLQRQAATARRYQALKEQERRLAAELLALRLRDLDSGGKVHDAAVRGRELAMQEALAAQRAAEAAIEKQRAVQTAHGERLSAVQGRYYQVGADISRLEQSIEHTRELRERQRADLAQAQVTLGELAAHIARDDGELAAVRAEIARLAPEREAAQQAEQRTGAALEASEQALQEWQQRWEEHTRAASGAQQSTEVERTRIEQLENQLRQLRAQAERLAGERLILGAQDGGPQLGQLALEESEARRASERCTGALVEAQARVQALRTAQLGCEARLEGTRGARAAARGELTALEAPQAAAQARVQALRTGQRGCEERREGTRGAREAACGELTSLEALQAAALSDHAGQAAEWLRGAGLAARPRLAADLEVEPGWERAVETALGDYLEAVCVERLEELSGALAGLAAGRLTLVESGERACGAEAKTLAAHVKGPPAVIARLAAVSTAESLGKALAARGALVDGRSFITAAGEWVGRDWLRVSRGPDPRAGTLEREHRLRSLRGASAQADQRVAEAEAELAAARERQAQAE